jgi:hypothetical protein
MEAVELRLNRERIDVYRLHIASPSILFLFVKCEDLLARLIGDARATCSAS